MSLEENRQTAAFEYDPAFVASGIQLSPLMMPLAAGVHSFPALAQESFHGLPGLLADSLPDKFGNALIDAWLATQGRKAEDFDSVERLLYTGNRGMGALEFKPAKGPRIRIKDVLTNADGRTDEGSVGTFTSCQSRKMESGSPA